MHHSLSKILVSLLNESGLSQNELARRTGIAQQVIQRLASGSQKNPTVETLIPLADYFMLSIDQLLGKRPLPKSIAVNPEHQGWSMVPFYNYHQLLTSYLKNNFVMKTEKQVPCDIPISTQAFALAMPDHSMEPRFIKDTVMIFDPSLEPKHKHFILLYDQKVV